ncbi:MAG: hypothetical protein CME71_04085 [Halobacteriovorax sp.]|nr:hypothetical protein [Halobacteriovorax sp.]|tara:strand:- start:592 stop:1521 length:930 start_codon:yes stop_codon:yes gene_type:complete
MSTSNFDNHSLVSVQAKYPAMGGEFVFLAYPQKFLSRSDVSELFALAAKEINRIEHKLTDFKDSDFNRINDHAGIKPHVVDDEIFALLQTALSFSKATNGLFDISFASLAHRTRGRKKLTSKEFEYYKSLINYKNIKLDEELRSISFAHKDMRIGFGGIGKGYAVDRAFEFLKDNGLVNFSVNGSGDMRVHSAPDAPRPWRLGIRNPFAKDPSKAAGLIQLSNGALVTSGNYVRGDHIINTTSDNPGQLASVTLIDENALSADVLATALMNLSSNKAMDFLNSKNLLGLAIDSNGKTHLSSKALSHFGL